MKTRLHVVMLSLAVGAFFSAIIHTQELPNTTVYPSAPPAGWKIETNGTEFRWVDPQGHGAKLKHPTYRDAVHAAWDMLEFDRNNRLQENAWREAK